MPNDAPPLPARAHPPTRPWPQVVLVVRVEAPDNKTIVWHKENQDLVDRISAAFPGTVDYATAPVLSSAQLAGMFHCADVLIHAPTQEVLES
jgi:hypothetical protein